jgi:hypothetical protein
MLCDALSFRRLCLAPNRRNVAFDVTRAPLFPRQFFVFAPPVGTIARSRHNVCIGKRICAIQNKKQTDIDFLYQYLVFIEPQ